MSEIGETGECISAILRTAEVLRVGLFTSVGSCGTQVLGYTADDVTQPRMRGLVVEPSQPDHGCFDRFGGT